MSLNRLPELNRQTVTLSSSSTDWLMMWHHIARTSSSVISYFEHAHHTEPTNQPLCTVKGKEGVNWMSRRWAEDSQIEPNIEAGHHFIHK